jgi:hypothetical protein
MAATTKELLKDIKRIMEASTSSILLFQTFLAILVINSSLFIVS